MESRELDDLIDELGNLLHSPRVFIPMDWGQLWDKAKQIQVGFKGIRYPSRDAREAAWQRFNAIRDELAQRSNREKQELRGESERFRSEILSLVRSAEPNNLFGFSPVDVESMKAYGAKLNEARRVFSSNKSRMLGEHRRECVQAFEDMKRTHDLWWDDLGRDRSRRKGERRERILSNLEKNRERYRKTADALQRTRAFVDDIRDKIASAWNDNWAADAERRLSDAEDRIRDMEDSLRQIEDWIEEDERQLNDL